MIDLGVFINQNGYLNGMNEFKNPRSLIIDSQQMEWLRKEL